MTSAHEMDEMDKLLLATQAANIQFHMYLNRAKLENYDELDEEVALATTFKELDVVHRKYKESLERHEQELRALVVVPGAFQEIDDLIKIEKTKTLQKDRSKQVRYEKKNMKFFNKRISNVSYGCGKQH